MQRVLHEILSILDCYIDHSRIFEQVLLGVANGSYTREEGVAEIIKIIDERWEEGADGFALSTDRTLCTLPFDI